MNNPNDLSLVDSSKSSTTSTPTKTSNLGVKTPASITSTSAGANKNLTPNSATTDVRYEDYNDSTGRYDHRHDDAKSVDQGTQSITTKTSEVFQPTTHNLSFAVMPPVMPKITSDEVSTSVNPTSSLRIKSPIDLDTTHTSKDVKSPSTVSTPVTKDLAADKTTTITPAAKDMSTDKSNATTSTDLTSATKGVDKTSTTTSTDSTKAPTSVDSTKTTSVDPTKATSSTVDSTKTTSSTVDPAKSATTDKTSTDKSSTSTDPSADKHATDVKSDHKGDATSDHSSDCNSSIEIRSSIWEVDNQPTDANSQGWSITAHPVTDPEMKYIFTSEGVSTLYRSNVITQKFESGYSKVQFHDNGINISVGGANSTSGTMPNVEIIMNSKDAPASIVEMRLPSCHDSKAHDTGVHNADHPADHPIIF